MSNLKEILTNRNICKSVWFMRQAGRYLPEFRDIKQQNQDFIKLCLNSKLSTEITLQPIKRFDIDSAIIFSDILLVPHALGQGVNFIKDSGPKLEAFDYYRFVNNDRNSFTKKGSSFKFSTDSLKISGSSFKELFSFGSSLSNLGKFIIS